MTTDSRCLRSATQAVTFRCDPMVKSVVELTGIMISNPVSDKTVFLEYPKAAVWDFISRDYSFSQVVKLISAITSLAELEVEQFVLECLNEWTDAGFLIREDSIG